MIDTWRGKSAAWLLGLVVLALALWAYLPVLLVFAYRWSVEPDYVHGFLVLPFALVLLWSRRDQLNDGWGQPSWWGLVLVAAAGGLWLLGADRGSPVVVGLSLLPLLWGIALFVGGGRTLVWSWSAIAFLAFMIPLPKLMAEWLREPLREIGASASVFIIQVLGMPAAAEGTHISLRNAELSVADVCSGVRMLMLFFAVCVAAALILETKPWERIVMIISAIPIAIIANVLRITVTAILHDLVGADVADRVFHDLAGWLMMPVAIVLLISELALIRRMFHDDKDHEDRQAGLTPAGV